MFLQWQYINKLTFKEVCVEKAATQEEQLIFGPGNAFGIWPKSVAQMCLSLRRRSSLPLRYLESFMLPTGVSSYTMVDFLVDFLVSCEIWDTNLDTCPTACRCKRAGQETWDAEQRTDNYIIFGVWYVWYPQKYMMPPQMKKFGINEVWQFAKWMWFKIR